MLGLLTIAGLYVKRKFYDSKNRSKMPERHVSVSEAKGKLHDGDIIFQTSLSGQSKAIQLATRSEYSHCGIVYKISGNYFVYEAVGPVKLTPLSDWTSRGLDGHFVIKRLKKENQVLTISTLNKMKESGKIFSGRPYDIYFDWSDKELYCSELIWKVYKEATGLNVGKLEKLRDFDLTSEAVKRKLKERYGNKIPLDETVISPVSIFNSDLLETVYLN